MAKVPDVLDQKHGMKALVKAFMVQVEYLTDIRDQLFDLHRCGRLEYQSCTYRFHFRLNGLRELESTLARLKVYV